MLHEFKIKLFICSAQCIYVNRMLINLFKLKLFIYVFSSMHLRAFYVYEFIKLKLN